MKILLIYPDIFQNEPFHNTWKPVEFVLGASQKCCQITNKVRRMASAKYFCTDFSKSLKNTKFHDNSWILVPLPSPNIQNRKFMETVSWDHKGDMRVKLMEPGPTVSTFSIIKCVTLPSSDEPFKTSGEGHYRPTTRSSRFMIMLKL